jgi:hypothetical protein
MYLFIISFGNNIIGKSNMATPLSTLLYFILYMTPMSGIAVSRQYLAPPHQSTQ